MEDAYHGEGDPGDYTDRQEAHDREYERAWDSAPPEFKEAAAKLGVPGRETEKEHDESVREFDNNHSSVSYTSDMAKAIDTHVDGIIERYGNQHAVFIRQIAEDLRRPMDEAFLSHQALLLGRIAGYLILDEKGVMKARLHALLHSVPRFASEAGFPSLRSSARKCGVSPEWLRRARDKWCIYLGIEPPVTGTKTEAAKEKYRQNALNNHWRHQTYKCKKTTEVKKLN